MLNSVSDENRWTVTPEAWLDIVIQSYMIKFPMLKMQTPQQTIIHIWTTRAFYNRLWYSELFSTVAYLEMKLTQNPRSKGKKGFRRLMDLLPLEKAGSTELWEKPKRGKVYRIY
ncbi:uncharacterized protein TNCV_922531 [Trichonephila clavipes]|nr:uncharacterized protein TNCV_922531 [Trichonephila clavipes]